MSSLALPSRLLRRLGVDRNGAVTVAVALALPVLALAAGAVIDVAMARLTRIEGQQALDIGVLAAAVVEEPMRRATADGLMSVNGGWTEHGPEKARGATAVSIISNRDGSVTGTVSTSYRTSFLRMIGINEIPLNLRATAIAKTGSLPCFIILANQSMALNINSGAKVEAPECSAHVHSVTDPAYSMASNSTFNTALLCTRRKSELMHGNPPNLNTACKPIDDPYADVLPQPTVPSVCTTSDLMEGPSFTLPAGMHCNVTFKDGTHVTFAPGLHVIKGRMLVGAGSTISARGVSFYFPDTDSEIRANGGIKLTATAPTSGPYRDLLMFERTSDAGNNAAKRQYVFNGSVGEQLEGIIHLPNRDVVYNSTTLQTNRVSIVANTMIINFAEWNVAPYESISYGSRGHSVAHLVE